MKEDFLQYVWKFQKLNKSTFKSVQGNRVNVITTGDHNEIAGPDFIGARIAIDGQEWAGNIEIHIKSSDWYVHKHQEDVAYNNVVLHVVWEDDVAVFDQNNNQLETVELKGLIDEMLIQNYESLIEKKKWIFCENNIRNIDAFTWVFWKEQLIVRRLKRKIIHFERQLSEMNNDWETLLFILLAQNFGLKLNTLAFEQMARNLSFKVFRKEHPEVLSLEALLFGQANLLDRDSEDSYVQQLLVEYDYLKHKYKLIETGIRLNFYGMRPTSFPTIRLSQLAAVYHKRHTLFLKVIEAKTMVELYNIFEAAASSYWDTHYTFGKKSGTSVKKLSKSFIDLLIINTVIPLKFMYARSRGKECLEKVLVLLKAIMPEKNKITSNFEGLGVKLESAADSQALIELKTRFCNEHKCLRCQIGNKLLYTT